MQYSIHKDKIGYVNLVLFKMPQNQRTWKCNRAIAKATNPQTPLNHKTFPQMTAFYSTGGLWLFCSRRSINSRSSAWLAKPLGGADPSLLRAVDFSVIRTQPLSNRVGGSCIGMVRAFSERTKVDLQLRILKIRRNSTFAETSVLLITLSSTERKLVVKSR